MYKNAHCSFTHISKLIENEPNVHYQENTQMSGGTVIKDNTTLKSNYDYVQKHEWISHVLCCSQKK